MRALHACTVVLAVCASLASTGCWDAYADVYLPLTELEGTGGTGGTGGSDPGCIPSNISEAVPETCDGVFLRASADAAAADGTREHPFATLASAVAKSSRIYACADSESLDESIDVDTDVTLYGGLDCKTWVYTAGSKTTWTAPGGEVVLTIKKGSTLRAEDFAITAGDAPALLPNEYAAGRSSIAILAETASTVELERCDVNAGKGGDGAAGEPAIEPATAGAMAENGVDGCVLDDAIIAPGNGGAGTCEATDVSGGLGGIGTKNMSGGDGSDGSPADEMGKGGLGQKAATPCEEGGAGKPGDTGAAGAGAAPDTLGSLSAAGFVGLGGSTGTAGTPGHGGGGGGGAKLCANSKAGPSGAGGGAGGCAGAGGKGGYGGGASFGIVSIGATLNLSEVKIVTATGGKGGAGASGQPGGAGGNGGAAGAGDAQAKACGGGKGGDGGPGGRGGGGRGGHSIGVAYTIAEPDTKGAAIQPGMPGEGGTGDGATGNGAVGVADTVRGF